MTLKEQNYKKSYVVIKYWSRNLATFIFLKSFRKLLSAYMENTLNSKKGIKIEPLGLIREQYKKNSRSSLSVRYKFE